jgi:hypothetical protein
VTAIHSLIKVLGKKFKLVNAYFAHILQNVPKIEKATKIIEFAT